jgi:hypothetical protein
MARLGRLRVVVGSSTLPRCPSLRDPTSDEAAGPPRPLLPAKCRIRKSILCHGQPCAIPVTHLVACSLIISELVFATPPAPLEDFCIVSRSAHHQGPCVHDIKFQKRRQG